MKHENIKPRPIRAEAATRKPLNKILLLEFHIQRNLNRKKLRMQKICGIAKAINYYRFPFRDFFVILIKFLHGVG